MFNTPSTCPTHRRDVVSIGPLPGPTLQQEGLSFPLSPTTEDLPPQQGGWLTGYSEVCVAWLVLLESPNQEVDAHLIGATRSLQTLCSRDVVGQLSTDWKLRCPRSGSHTHLRPTATAWTMASLGSLVLGSSRRLKLHRRYLERGCSAPSARVGSVAHIRCLTALTHLQAAPRLRQHITATIDVIHYHTHRSKHSTQRNRQTLGLVQLVTRTSEDHAGVEYRPTATWKWRRHREPANRQTSD